MGKQSRWSEVAGEMGTFVRDAGFSVVESFVGHGIGREMHEDPQVPNFVSAQLRRNGDFRPGAGAGDRGRADGQHGDQARQRHARPLDPGHPRWPAQCPFRAHDRHDGQRPLGAHRAAPTRKQPKTESARRAAAGGCEYRVFASPWVLSGKTCLRPRGLERFRPQRFIFKRFRPLAVRRVIVSSP